MAIRIPLVAKPVCSSSTTKINTQQLRTQLDQLHAEADSTRAKANSARMRLLRLSEAAEKLKRQAAISVNSGKENEARELLVHKKKIVQAMEKSKSRIELLDQLSAKLNEAISIKESLLVGNVGLDLEIESDGAYKPVRIMSPDDGVVDAKDENNCSFISPGGLSNQDEQFGRDTEASSQTDKELASISKYASYDDIVVAGLVSISSYEDFLKHLHLQFNKIEAELVSILNVSALVLSDEDKPKNSKVLQIVELLENVRSIRNRIGRIMHGDTEIR